MVEETRRLLDDTEAGRAWNSFQRSEVGRDGLRTESTSPKGDLSARSGLAASACKHGAVGAFSAIQVFGGVMRDRSFPEPLQAGRGYFTGVENTLSSSHLAPGSASGAQDRGSEGRAS